MPLPRDERAPHDQIIDHDLINMDDRKLLSMLIIEVRRLRVQIAALNPPAEPPKE